MSLYVDRCDVYKRYTFFGRTCDPRSRCSWGPMIYTPYRTLMQRHHLFTYGVVSSHHVISVTSGALDSSKGHQVI